MAYAFSQLAPAVIGNEYLVVGTVEKKLWQQGLQALHDNVAPNTILNWFQDRANLQGLNNNDYLMLRTDYQLSITYGHFLLCKLLIFSLPA